MQTPQQRWLNACRVFSLNKHWPTSRVVLPHKAKGLEGRPDRPLPPPSGMTERQIAMAIELLQRAGFTLVRAPRSDGEWRPVKMI